MSRSMWKKPYSKKFIFKSLFINKSNKKNDAIFIRSRNSIIFPSFIGSTFYVYNGKKFVSLRISDNMIGYKFGEFIITRKRVLHKKK